MNFKSKINKYLQSVIILPALISAPFLGNIAEIPDLVLERQESLVEEIQALEAEALELEIQAKKIDAYFYNNGKWDLPAVGQGKTLVSVANEYGIDYALLPAIMMRESTGGKFTCGDNNAFGWGSPCVDFRTSRDAYRSIARVIGGHSDTMAHFYRDKTVYQILRTYNSVIPDYPNEVLAIMDDIKTQEV